MISGRKKRIVAILTTMAFLMTLLPLGTGMALASSGYSVLQEPVVSDDAVVELGTVFAEFPAGQLGINDTVTFKLPEDFEFRRPYPNHEQLMTQGDWDNFGTVSSGVYLGNYEGNYLLVPDTYGDEDNGLKGKRFKIHKLDNDEIKVELLDEPTAGLKCYMYFYLGSVYVDSGYSDDIDLVADSPSDSGFGSGVLTVGRATSGEVTITVNDVETFSDNEEITLRIKEDTAGALEDKDESLKFKLPTGFEWKGPLKLERVWGDDLGLDANNNIVRKNLIVGDVEIDDDELIINFNDGFYTYEATCFELTATVDVEDETEADAGDVVVKISGDTDLSVDNELTVAEYGEYNVNIEADGTPEVIAGQTEQEIADIFITEDVEESLVDGRTVILTLPSCAKWGDIDEDTDSGVRLDFIGFPGTDGRAAKWEVKGESNDAAELELEDMEIVIEPGTEGDLEIEVSGTAGLSGTIVVAKVKSAVSAKAENVPEVIIGMNNQEAGDIIITENAAGAIKDDKDLILDLPDGVKFAEEPTVEVTEGDLDVDEDGVELRDEGSQEDNQLVIPIDGESATASTIRVSGIKYVVDRTVPEGSITVKVEGKAVNEVNDEEEIEDYYTDIRNGDVVYIDGEECFDLDKEDGELMIWPQSTTAAKVVNARCITPAPKEKAAAGKALFTINSTEYSVGDTTETMDVAPYIKNGRTYLPLRYVGLALGVNPNNIMWDNVKRSATLIKGDRVVQVIIGSKEMTINGATVTMDVAPEIKDGRTMLPFRWIAQALGASVQWDEATQTVTMEM